MFLFLFGIEKLKCALRMMCKLCVQDGVKMLHQEDYNGHFPELLTKEILLLSGDQEGTLIVP